MVHETATVAAPETAVTHRVRAGFRLSKRMADLVAGRILYLEDKLGKKLAAKDVLDDARNPSSPLHEVYAAQNLWDDATAAERARLAYARYLLQAIEIVRVNEHGKEVTTPMFRSLPDEDADTGRSYSSVRHILAEEKSIAEVVAYERTIMRGCLLRIRQIEKLVKFADEIEEVLDRMAAATGAAKKRRRRK